MREGKIIIMCFAVTAMACCQPRPLSLSPIPSRIDRIEGHASLIISGDQGTARSKFSFLFQLPDRGRIDVTGGLGSTIYRIVIRGGTAYFVVPSKKVYWEGQEEDIIDKFMGFRLNLAEMIHLLSGNWSDREMSNLEGLNDWSLEKDQEGRIVSGKRNDLQFEVEDFIGDSPFAQSLRFEHPLNTGHVRILSIDLNQPAKPNVFSTEFTERYQPKSWQEIQELLNHAR